MVKDAAPEFADIGGGRQVACHLRAPSRRLTDTAAPSMTAS